MARFTWEEARRDLKYKRERALKLGGVRWWRGKGGVDGKPYVSAWTS